MLYETYSAKDLEEKIERKVIKVVGDYDEWKLKCYEWVLKVPFGRDSEWEMTKVEVKIFVQKKKCKFTKTWSLTIDL